MTRIKTEDTKISRRFFMLASAAAGGGLMLSLAACDRATDQDTAKATPIKALPLGTHITIHSDETITIMAQNPEVGQGVKTSLPMTIAEELDVDWEKVTVLQADLDPDRYNFQVAGGSLSSPFLYLTLRQVGATARHMLVAAAAAEWGVAAEDCTTRAGIITHKNSGRTIHYGAIAEKAIMIPVPDLESLPLKEQKDFTLIGKGAKGVDNPKIVTGNPLFSIDVRLPDMLYAVFVKCPAHSGKALSANLDEIRALPGIVDAFLVDETDSRPNGSGSGWWKPGEGRADPDWWDNGAQPDYLMSGVAIVADKWWKAQKAREKLVVTWDYGKAAAQSTDGFAEQTAAFFKNPPSENLQPMVGNVDKVLKKAAQTIDVEYYYPFLAHASLEPQNTTAHMQGDRVELWSAAQLPAVAQKTVANLLNIPAENVTFHITRGGGGFGRRLMSDSMLEAAWISKVVGKPVKLLWSREDDTQHDFYRPSGTHRIKAGLDKSGRIVALDDHFASFGSAKAFANSAAPGGPGYLKGYVPNTRYRASKIPLYIPTGAMRAPTSNAHAFVFESLVDELAHKAEQDPISFRLAHMDLAGEPPLLGDLTKNVPLHGFNPARMHKVLELVAERSGWYDKKRYAPQTSGKNGRAAVRRGMGVGCYFSHFGYFAEVVDLVLDADNRLTIEEVWVVGDIGRQVINPLNAENLIQGSVIDGLGQALGLEITFKDGQTMQSNFHDYPLIRTDMAPKKIDVHLHKTDHTTTGLGEPAMPPVIPALTNALYAATGVRHRTLPLKL